MGSAENRIHSAKGYFLRDVTNLSFELKKEEEKDEEEEEKSEKEISSTDRHF